MKDNKITTVDADNLRESIIKTLAVIARINEKEINDSILIKDELGIDSIMSLEIIANIEKRYNIQINEEDTMNITTVGEFIDYVIHIINKK
ncbi:MAG: acyl carrier protein [Spirochaetes bacterium]|nr:acyl carrier protein [Spirochaetota bacterium]